MSTIRNPIHIQDNAGFAARYDREAEPRGFGCLNYVLLIGIFLFVAFVAAVMFSPEVQSQFIQIAGL